jgi:hypothetical protein
VAASLNELRELAAQKDEESFSKEAMFASRKMNTRLAASRESLGVEDVPAASYLRRKSSQGKADPKPPQA